MNLEPGVLLGRIVLGRMNHSSLEPRHFSPAGPLAGLLRDLWFWPTAGLQAGRAYRPKGRGLGSRFRPAGAGWACEGQCQSPRACPGLSTSHSREEGKPGPMEAGRLGVVSEQGWGERWDIDVGKEG